MSPLAYDPKATVAGPAGTLTMAGLAVGVIVGLLSPVYAMVAGGIGLLVGLAFWFVRRPGLQLVARLGLGLVVGAALAWALNALGLVPQGIFARR